MSKISTPGLRNLSAVLALLLGQITIGAQPSSFTKLFATQALQIPQELARQNKNKIGDLDVSKLLEEIKQVQWFENQGLFLAGSGETRTGAMYFVKDKKVIVNAARAQFEPVRTMPIAALHEALGALGYIDENYEVSMTLYLNSLTTLEQEKIFPKTFIEKQNQKMQHIERRKTDAVYKNSGGGTSVGGGGDGIAIQVKAYALMFAPPICSQYKISCVDIHEKIMTSQIEINMKVQDQSPIYDGRVLRIPMISWINGNISAGDGLSVDNIRILKELIELIDQGQS